MRPLFIIFIILFASNPLMADPYVGFGIGSASYKVDLTEFSAGNHDDNGTATKLYGGYAFNKYFAAEASVYNFSEASIAAFETSPGGPVITDAAVSMKGVAAYAVGMYPVSKKVNLMAKLGVLSWDADLQANNQKASNDGTDVAFAQIGRAHV